MSDTVEIVVDGSRVRVTAGVSLAVALWNAGVHSLRTSLTGEPRAPLCGMGICFECRVTVDDKPHVRACMVTVRDGMDIRRD